jgi:hypothetical protein
MTDHIRIEMTGHGRGRVWINGEEVSVTRIEFKASSLGDEANELILGLVADRVDIAGPAEVKTDA